MAKKPKKQSGSKPKKKAAKKASSPKPKKPAAKPKAAVKRAAPAEPAAPKALKPLTMKQRLSLIRIDPTTGKCPHGLIPETCSFCMNI